MNKRDFPVQVSLVKVVQMCTRGAIRVCVATGPEPNSD